MSRNLQNTIANFGGVVSTTAFTIIFTMIYFRLLGSESYGLVSFCTTILIIGNVIVDRGIGIAITRELARREHAPDLAQEMRDVLFTLQTVHFSLALAFGLIIAGFSPWIATNWLQRETLDVGEAVQAIIVLGGIASLQLPRGLCHAALAGLQRQVFVNVCTAGFAFLRGIATIVGLYWVAPSPTIFLAVQLVVSAMETTALFVTAWRRMPTGKRRARFQLSYLSDVWVFATGDGLAILLGVAMHHGDRILLSRLLPLEVFGFYSLAILIADTLERGVGPFTGAYFPHFTDVIARDDKEQLSRDYHRITIVVAAVMIPAALLACFFPVEILWLVSGNHIAAEQFAAVMAVRVLATAFNTLQWFPHIIQLATGLSVFMLALNIASACLYLPGILLLTPVYGVIVPAALWLLVNIMTTIPMIWMTHRRALNGEAYKWVEGSLLRPAVVALGIVALSRFFAPSTVSWFVTVPWLGLTYLMAMIAVMSASGRTRPLLAVLRHGAQFR